MSIKTLCECCECISHDSECMWSNFLEISSSARKKWFQIWFSWKIQHRFFLRAPYKPDKKNCLDCFWQIHSKNLLVCNFVCCVCLENKKQRVTSHFCWKSLILSKNLSSCSWRTCRRKFFILFFEKPYKNLLMCNLFCCETSKIKIFTRFLCFFLKKSIFLKIVSSFSLRTMLKNFFLFVFQNYIFKHTIYQIFRF